MKNSDLDNFKCVCGKSMDEDTVTHETGWTVFLHSQKTIILLLILPRCVVCHSVYALAATAIEYQQNNYYIEIF